MAAVWWIVWCGGAGGFVSREVFDACLLAELVRASEQGAELHGRVVAVVFQLRRGPVTWYMCCVWSMDVHRMIGNLESKVGRVDGANRMARMMERIACPAALQGKQGSTLRTQ